MNKTIVLLTLFCMVIFLPVVSAEKEPVLVYSSVIQADKHVNPIGFSFFESAQPGKIRLTDIKNLWGSGAIIKFDLNTDKSWDTLYLSFDGPMVQLRLIMKEINILAGRLDSVNRTGIDIIIQDNQLTVNMDGRSRTISNITSFKGSGTTQSITGNLQAWVFREKE